MFPPLLDILLRQAALLNSYLRSAHTGSVVLLAAALLLPVAQGGQLLASVARAARASVTMTAEHAPEPRVVSAPEGQSVVKKSPRARLFATALVGLPSRLGSPETAPEPAAAAGIPERTSPVLERRDLERGPPFFL